MKKEIKELTKEELLDPDFISGLYNEYTDVKERTGVINEVLECAKKYRVLTNVKQNLQAMRFNSGVGEVSLEYNLDGTPKESIDNILNILLEDETIRDIYGYNSLSNKVIKVNSDGTYGPWTDNDDSYLMWYIEQTYEIYFPQKFFNAFNIACSRKKVNPIKDIIENKEWDGVPRIDKFLSHILKCEDNDYHREVSRMIFYGGINRLYQPGCKFDYMPILIGNQGCGKSTIVKWLALNETYYGDISSIEGKDALENIQGIWICELSELLAMVKTKDVEAMKSFITRTTDRFRESYGRRTKEYPRTTLFIGTTNDHQFLSDKTGNRRYLPVELNMKQGDLHRNEKKIHEYILECWREALYLYKNGETYLTIPSKYYNEVLKAQNSAVEDDPKTGMILDYLNEKKIGDRVCAIEVFTNCLNGLKKNFDRLQSKEISRLLSSLPEWERNKEGTHRFEGFGTQRYWEKVEVKDEWEDLE